MNGSTISKIPQSPALMSLLTLLTFYYRYVWYLGGVKFVKDIAGFGISEFCWLVKIG